MRLHEMLDLLKEEYGVETKHIGEKCGIKRRNAWNHYVKRSKDGKPINEDLLKKVNNYIHETYKGLENIEVI